MKAPRLARFLVGRTVAHEDRRFVLQDLDEGYARVRAASGGGAAWRWYWWQALRGGAASIRAGGAAEALTNGATGSDFRIAVRSLRRRPVYALGAVGALALGLTSAASVFAVAWHVWLAPLPMPDPERVVRVFELERAQEDGGAAPAERERLRLSPPLAEDLRGHTWTTLHAVTALSGDNFDWAHDDRTTRLTGLRTSAELATILGVSPLHGRFLGPDDHAPEVVLSEDFWLRAFGGDPAVGGGSGMELDGTLHQVVGVVRLPAGYPQATDVIAHLAFDEQSLGEGWRGARYLDGLARVRPGHTVAEASQELDAFVSGLGDAHPQHRGRGGLAVSLGRDLVAPYRGVLSLLLMAGGAFLALAVVNVSGLVVIRRAQGRHEHGIRAALGASRARLLLGEIMESTVVGAAAGGLGILFTYWVLTPLIALVPGRTPRIDEVGLDLPLSLGILGAALAVGVVVGLVGHVLTPLAPAVGRSHAGSTGLWGRRSLVVGQVALTTVLATGGVAVLRYVGELRSVDIGFEPRGVLTRMVVLSENRFPSDDAVHAAWDGILQGLRSRGIQAAVGANPPITGVTMRYGYRVPAHPEEERYAQYHAVSDGYFETLGIRLAEGRGVADTDQAGSEPVVVVNEAMARREYPQGAVGEMLRLVGTERRIIGVVASTRHFGPDADAPDEVYVPLRQDRPTFAHVLMRTTLDDAGAIAADVIAGVDPTAPPQPTVPFTDHVAAWFAPLTLQLAVVSALGLVGLVLVALGLYALVAYQVSLRRREIGIRKALGAPVGGLFRGVVAQGVTLSVVGLVVGLAAWYLLVPTLSGLVVGLDARGLAVPLVVAGVVAAISVLATLAPAWRSSVVDPAIALQAE